MNFSAGDYLVFIGYILGIVLLGLWASRNKKGHEKNSEDYFLAGKTLPWWAIGASLIAAATLLVGGEFFLPIFLEKQLYTIPEFIEKHFSTDLKTILAVLYTVL